MEIVSLAQRERIATPLMVPIPRVITNFKRLLQTVELVTTVQPTTCVVWNVLKAITAQEILVNSQ